MSDTLDMKNGRCFEAETEYLYQKRIAELELLLNQAMDIISRRNYESVERNWYERARVALRIEMTDAEQLDHVWPEKK